MDMHAIRLRHQRTNKLCDMVISRLERRLAELGREIDCDAKSPYYKLLPDANVASKKHIKNKDLRIKNHV